MFSVIARKKIYLCRQTTSKIKQLLFFKRFQSETKFSNLDVLVTPLRCYQESFLHTKAITTTADAQTNTSVSKSVHQKKKPKSTTKNHVKKQYIELNKKIANANSCNEILNLIEHSLDKNAGGGLLNHVCFSTSFNRLARYSSRNAIDRNNLIRDKRFSLLFAGLAEALVSENKHQEDSNLHFDSQALANIGWAIAKLGITAPTSQLPNLQSYELHNKDGDDRDISGLMAPSEKTLLASARDIRSNLVHDTSRLDYMKKSSRDKQTTLIPESELTVLASQILDFIGILVTTKIEAAIAGDFANAIDMMNLQHCANLFWAFATAGRADPKVFELVAMLMIDRLHELQDSGPIEGLKPQVTSNTLWAVSVIKFLKKFNFCLVTQSVFCSLITISNVLITRWHLQI
jgi:hypothetical protein